LGGGIEVFSLNALQSFIPLRVGLFDNLPKGDFLLMCHGINSLVSILRRASIPSALVTITFLLSCGSPTSSENKFVFDQRYGKELPMCNFDVMFPDKPRKVDTWHASTTVGPFDFVMECLPAFDIPQEVRRDPKRYEAAVRSILEEHAKMNGYTDVGIKEVAVTHLPEILAVRASELNAKKDSYAISAKAFYGGLIPSLLVLRIRQPSDASSNAVDFYNGATVRKPDSQ
jgi:hypothetical protein